MKKLKPVIFILLLSLGCLSALSQSNQMRNLEAKRKAVLDDIKNTNSLLLKIKKTTENLLDRIKLNTEQIRMRQNVIAILNQEINSITAEQRKTEVEIKALEVELKEKQKKYAAAIDGMIHKRHNQNKLMFILSGKSFGESIRRMKYLKEYSEWRNQQAEDIKNQQTELIKKKETLEKTRKEKIALLAQRESEQLSLKKQEITLSEDVKEATGKQKDLEALANKQQQQADKLNAQIERIIAEELARREREAKRIAEERARIAKEKSSNKGKGSTDKAPEIQLPDVVNEYNKLTNNFASNKGRIPMPVSGKALIVSRFGVRPHPFLPRVKVNNTGIKIQVQPGATARSVFDGRVIKVLATAGANNSVLVSHGDYITLYSNLKDIYVQEGQSVKAGDNLGKVYTENGNTLLEFTLRNKMRLLNPEEWIKR